MAKQASDIDFIKSFYSKYEFNSPTQVPDFKDYLHPNIKVTFNNETFASSDVPGLIEVFFTSMHSIKIEMVGDIKPLNDSEGLYLVLSNWYCKTIKGIEGMCPMLEIFTIKDQKIIEAVAMMDTTTIGKL
jgi:hypothetical protein